MSGASFDRTTPATMIDLRYVKKLIEILDESTVDSLEISSDKGMKIRLSKSPAQRGAVTMHAPMAMPAAPAPAAAAPARAGGDAGGAAAEAEAPRAAADKLLEVKSPMVGTFYGAPEPGAKPYVTVGQRVEKGQTLCIIEAMKIMNEIECEFAGTVREANAQDAQPVEYGQVLFRIDPNG
jgi:acetyl-CoA carboxylase biotin carboxyl carrier protein